MKKLLLLMSCFFSAHCFAWSGSYIGEGEAIYNQRKMECDFIEIRFMKLTDDMFILRGGAYKCGPLQAEYPYSVFKIVDSMLVYGGEIVGELKEDKISFNFEEFTLSLKKGSDENSLDYLETWDDGRDFLQIKGKLNQFE